MPSTRPAIVEGFLGVDVSRGAWAGILWAGETLHALYETDISALVTQAGALSQEKLCALRVVAIDIPLDPPSSGVRRADSQARKALPGKGSSLFTTPARSVLQAASLADAQLRNRADQGQGLSAQTFAIVAKIRQADVWRKGLAPDCGFSVIEVHPELSFAHMDCSPQPTPIRARKVTFGGVLRRMERLEQQGLRLTECDGEIDRIGTDDLIDAAAAAWSARRYHLGTAVAFPGDAAPDEAVIWA